MFVISFGAPSGASVTILTANTGKLDCFDEFHSNIYKVMTSDQVCHTRPEK